MKTFYDLQDIETTVKIKIALSAIVDNGAAHAKIICNNRILHNAPITDNVVINDSVNLLDTINLTVIISNKVYSSQQETAVVVDSVYVDGFEIIPRYNHCTEYINDHNQQITTNYLGYNGTWSLHIELPFYQWLHQQTGQGWLLQPHRKNPENHQKRY